MLMRTEHFPEVAMNQAMLIVVLKFATGHYDFMTALLSTEVENALIQMSHV